MRDKCRYFHPPAHIKDRLVMAGKHFGMMMSSYPPMVGATFQPCVRAAYSLMVLAALLIIITFVWGPLFLAISTASHA